MPVSAGSTPLRIGFDGTCLSNRRGFGRFARGILDGLAETNPGHLLEVVIDTPSSAGVNLPQCVSLKTVPTRTSMASAASARGNRPFNEIIKMSRAVHAARYDVFYFPASFSYFPVAPWRKMVVTMHDTLAVDRPDLVFPTRRGRWFWWAKEQVARRNASRLTTVSASSRSDLARYFHIDENAIGLVTEGVEPVFLRPVDQLPIFPELRSKYNLTSDEPYWLYVGGLSPHKNLLRLIESFAGLPRHMGRLVLVGDFGDTFHTHVPEIRAKSVECGVEDRVILTGFVPDDELAVFYRHARAVVLPSLWEGFGLPAAEAMACGTPVLHSRAGSLPEVVGNAGIVFDPEDVSDIRAKWLQFAGDEALQKELSVNALERSKLYRWEVAGRLLWHEILTLAGRPEINTLQSGAAE